jgi:hypothetical protein
MFRLNKISRFDHWNCSRLANKIRGTDKPFALEWGVWDEWHKDAKNKHPYRYWVAEKLLNTLQNIYMFPMDVWHTIEVYIRNRFIDKTHYLKTGLKAGEYYDLDYRIINGLFYELVDLVEIEYAAFRRDNKKYKFVRGRCVEAGLDYLKWSASLTYDSDYGVTEQDKEFGKPTSQAVTAQKTLELYNWWKNRPNRLDPYDLYTKEKDGKYYWKQIDKLEKKYEKEDTDMLISLIKIRGGLWT